MTALLDEQASAAPRPPDQPPTSPPDADLALHPAPRLMWAQMTVSACVRELIELTAAPTGDDGVLEERGAQLEELAATLRQLEELRCTTQAAQAALTVRLDAGTRAREAAAGTPAARRGRAVAHEVALARRTSPSWGRRLVALAKILPSELPHTWEAFRTGRVGEQVAIAIAAATACLSVEHRLEVDRLVAGDADALEQMSEKQIRRMTAKHAARLDPASVVARRRVAVGERRVSVTPAPDAMSRLTITVPVEQGVAAYASLKKHADSLFGTAESTGRGRGALMADAAIERLTGQATADGVPVRINLVMTSHALLGGDGDAAAGGARITERGVGTFGLADAVARRIAQQGLSGTTTVWLRRLYAHPASSQLVALEARSRRVPKGLATFITLRDQTCSTRYCDAPVRHIDHIVPAGEGGATEASNLQGLCEACNHAKQAPDWRQTSHLTPDGTLQVDTQTPAGQRHRTQPPAT